MKEINLSLHTGNTMSTIAIHKNTLNLIEKNELKERIKQRKIRREAKRLAEIAEINSQYELIKSRDLSVEQKQILDSDEYKDWLHQETRIFDRNGDERPYLSQKYKWFTTCIIFKSMEISWAIFCFESDWFRSNQRNKAEK